MTDKAINDAISKAIYEEEKRRLLKEDENERYEIKRKRDLENIKEFRTYCRQATPDDYAEWIKGYLLRGGKITSVYDYPFPNDRWFYLLTKPREVPKLYGSLSINVIVSKESGLYPSELLNTGHNQLYFINGFRPIGPGLVVPLYSDIIDTLRR